MALVDLYEGKLIALEDHPGAIAHQPVPEDIFNQDVLGPKFKETKLQIAPSTLQDIKLDRNLLQWENWDFRFSFNQRDGLVLHQIAFNDQGKLRSICYRASISEMLVPYSDPSKSWVWRQFFDSGEYGLGYVSTEANAGKDLPENAVTFNAVLPTESLDLSFRLREPCLFLRTGWRRVVCVYAAGGWQPQPHLCPGKRIGDRICRDRWELRLFI
jgi:primary-amine oxidase